MNLVEKARTELREKYLREKIELEFKVKDLELQKEKQLSELKLEIKDLKKELEDLKIQFNSLKKFLYH